MKIDLYLKFEEKWLEDTEKESLFLVKYMSDFWLNSNFIAFRLRLQYFVLILLFFFLVIAIEMYLICKNPDDTKKFSKT